MTESTLFWTYSCKHVDGYHAFCIPIAPPYCRYTWVQPSLSCGWTPTWAVFFATIMFIACIAIVAWIGFEHMNKRWRASLRQRMGATIAPFTDSELDRLGAYWPLDRYGRLATTDDVRAALAWCNVRALALTAYVDNATVDRLHAWLSPDGRSRLKTSEDIMRAIGIMKQDEERTALHDD